MTDLEPGGPYSPDRTAEVAAMMAGAVRYLSHATFDRHGTDSLTYPADLDRVVAHLEVMAQRMPQLIGQLREWLITQAGAGRTEVTYGRFEGRPELAAEVVAMSLDVAAARFTEAARALHDAHQVTSAIASGDDGTGE